MAYKNFQRQIKTVDVDQNKAIESIDIRLVMNDANGKVNAADIMLQGGGRSTVWTGHPAEIPWSFDK